MLTSKISVAEILEAVSGELIRGEKTATIETVSEPGDASEKSVSFFISPQFLEQLSSCKAAVIVIQENLWRQVSEKKITVPATVVITAKDAYLGLARLTRLFVEKNPHGDWLHETNAGFIHPTAKIAKSAVLMPGVVVGPLCEIGENCVLFPGVVLYPRTRLGDRVRLHAHVVIGADGFGYAKGPRGSEKIWHLGRVVIGNDVEIGANSCVDRGTLRDTIIEDSVKIDNLVQVGHNGHLKSHAILCAQTGLAGNVTIGRGSILAGQAGIADKVEVGDGCIVGPQAGISKDIPPGEIHMGALVAKPRKEWWKLNAYFDRLPEFFERLKKLEGSQK